MGGYETQLPVDEKLGYELYPIGDGDSGCDTPTPCELPTPEQVFEIWETHFAPLLKFLDNHDPILLALFEENPLQYVKNVST